jgi:LCP family protein required for cell wall assembly
VIATPPSRDGDAARYHSPPMGARAKPYRRFRARGTTEREAGLDALRALNRDAGPGGRRRGGGGRSATATAEPPEVGAPERERERRPPRPSRTTRRALARSGRRWWSLRGLGVLGWTWRIAVLLLVVLVVWGVWGYLTLNSAVGDANAKVTKNARKALVEPSGGILGSPQNTLILGSDGGRLRSGQRADTILIMRTDPDNGRIKYLSIPRDFMFDFSQLGLSRLGTGKINSAFRYGGQSLMIRAVRRLTGLPINHLVVIQFKGLSRAVDALGGVTVNNPTPLRNCYYEAGQYVTFRKGDIHLNGKQALAYARVRKCDTDFERARRQQALVAGLKGEVLSWSHLYDAPWRGADVIRSLTTDLGTFDLIKLGWLQARLKQDPKDRLVLPGEPRYIGGVAYVVGDPGADEEMISRFVGKK